MCGLITQRQATEAAFSESSHVQSLAYQQHTVARSKPSVYKISNHCLSTPPRQPRPHTMLSAAERPGPAPCTPRGSWPAAGDSSGNPNPNPNAPAGVNRRPGPRRPLQHKNSARPQRAPSNSQQANMRPCCTAPQALKIASRAGGCRARRSAAASCARLRLLCTAPNQAAKPQQNLLTHAPILHSPSLG
jgi:hypothetical protein